MSSDELRAAERLLANSWDVYGDRPTNDDDEWFALADKITADGAMLARAYRREHWPQAEQGERCPDCGATGGVHREGCSELPDESSQPTAEQPPAAHGAVELPTLPLYECEISIAGRDLVVDYHGVGSKVVILAAEVPQLFAWLNRVMFHLAQPTRERELEAVVERLRAELDPPVCRLQFPDGSVPGNAREAAEGWKRVADSLTAKLSEVERERNEAVAGNIETMRRQVRERMTSEADLFKDKSVADLLDCLTTAITSLPTAFHPLMAAIHQALAEAERRAEAAEETTMIVLGNLEWNGDGYEWTGGQYDYRMQPAEAVACTVNLIASLRRRVTESESALSTLRDQERSLREALENGERFYQLELREDDGWVALSDRVHDGAVNFKSTADWFDAAKVYHTYQDMRLVQVTKRVLHERTALATAEPPAQGAE